MSSPTYQLKIAGIIQETADARSFIFEVPEDLRKTFSYKAGQFLTFQISYNSMRIKRCYSFSSAPECDPRPKVTVKRVEDGRVSNWFNDKLQVGDTIDVEPPEGRFLLHADERKRGLILLGGGSGITPVASLMKSALRTTERPVKLIYANRDAASVIFKDEIDLWKAAYPSRFEVVHHLDSERGFLTAKDLQQLITGWEDGEFYVCGPEPYMDACEEAFHASGVDRGRTKFERFVSLPDPDRRAAPTEAEAAPGPPGKAPASFSMTLEGATHQVPCVPGKTLLECATEAGFKPPSSCEDGYCGCCMALMKSGSVKMKSSEALTDSDIERGWILTCQSRPDEDEPLEVDYDAQY